MVVVFMIIILIIHQEVQQLIMVQDNKEVIHPTIQIIMNMIIFMEKLKHLSLPVLIIIHIQSVRKILKTPLNSFFLLI